MNLDYALYPKLIKTIESPFNGTIEVFRTGGSYRLDVGGLTQSGSVMTHVWKWGVDALLPHDFNPSKILMLGVAGGSAISWLAHKFPQAQIVGVDIDPVIVEVGKEFFGLNNLKNLKIVISDAVKFLKTNKESFDIIFTDCYKGYETPLGFEDLDFLTQVKKYTQYFFINRLYWGEHVIDSTAYEIKLRERFEIQTTATESNLIISLISEKSI